MLQPDDPLTVTLTIEKWQKVVNLLAETGPYRVVHPLIQELGQQIETGVNALSAKGNGATAMFGPHAPPS